MGFCRFVTPYIVEIVTFVYIIRRIMLPLFRVFSEELWLPYRR